MALTKASLDIFVVGRRKMGHWKAGAASVSTWVNRLATPHPPERGSLEQFPRDPTEEPHSHPQRGGRDQVIRQAGCALTWHNVVKTAPCLDDSPPHPSPGPPRDRHQTDCSGGKTNHNLPSTQKNRTQKCQTYPQKESTRNWQSGISKKTCQLNETRRDRGI